MKLRTYQLEAKQAAYHFLADNPGQSPLIVLPTGAGKSPLIAAVCRDAGLHGRRVLVLAHRRELLEQTAAKVRQMAPDLDFGVYSAGWGRREADAPILLAQIQSVHRRAVELGERHVVLVDEAHLIPPAGDGVYRRLLEGLQELNPGVRLIGLTATPFRTATGMLYGEGQPFDAVCFEAGVQELTDQGYLSPLVTRVAFGEVDTKGLHIRAGEFIASEAESLMDREQIVRAACQEIVTTTCDRQSVLIFSAGVQHGLHVRDVIQSLGGTCEFVHGGTSKAERRSLLDAFTTGRLKYLVNCDLLTTGFDQPGIDAIAILRPTMSPGLWYQMVGRGLRIAPGKADCLILDFGGNGLRHGPITALRVPKGRESGKDRRGEPAARMCPECRTVVAAGCSACPACGYEFPARERRLHSAHANQEGDSQVLAVRAVTYWVHSKRNAPPDHPKTLGVEYGTQAGRFREFVAVEHSGLARKLAEVWWRERAGSWLPHSAGKALRIAMAGGLAEPSAIIVQHLPGERFPKIVGCEWAEESRLVPSALSG